MSGSDMGVFRKHPAFRSAHAGYLPFAKRNPVDVGIAAGLHGSIRPFSLPRTAASFSRLPKPRDRRSIGSRRPNHGPSSRDKEAAMGQDVRSPPGTQTSGPRCIALVGPFQSGKTTLLEAILARTGAIKTAGSVDAGTSVGDASPEARHHKMGVGLSAATTTFMGDSYTFIDCPGSIEFAHDMRAALPAVDAAVVVCEADEKKLPQLQ